MSAAVTSRPDSAGEDGRKAWLLTTHQNLNIAFVFHRNKLEKNKTQQRQSS